MERDLSMTKVKTPLGPLWLVALGDALWAAELEPRWASLAHRLGKKGCEIDPGAVRRKDQPILDRAARAIRDYLSGDYFAPQRVPLALEGTRLQLAVWKRVRKIRPGRTLTYAELAAAVGMEGAFRAIGAANGANPCALFVPDHRIVGSNGGLAGYGAGVEAKAWLLAHEGVSY